MGHIFKKIYNKILLYNFKIGGLKRPLNTCNLFFFFYLYQGTTSKPNHWLTGGSIRFWPVSIVLNNDNRLEPDGPVGQLLVGFSSRPKHSSNVLN